MTELERKLLDDLSAGRDMRSRQIAYFQIRSRELLIASKEAEKRFDTLAAEAFAMARQTHEGR